MSGINRFRPAVRKAVLFFVAGSVWLCVGMMLLGWSRLWLSDVDGLIRYALAGGGLLLALCVHAFGFSKIADKNIARIMLMSDENCVFAFISWKSYLVILVMVAMGAVVRHSAVPMEYLSVLYTGIGCALILSSVRYMDVLVKHIRSGR